MRKKIAILGSTGSIGKTLLDIIKKIIPSNSNIKYLDLPENDPKVRKPNIKLAREILEWNPKISINEGLKLTFKYYKSLHKFKS